MRAASRVRSRSLLRGGRAPRPILLWVAGLALAACSDDGRPETVGLARPTEEMDGGQLPDAASPFVRPDSPLWPATDGMVELAYRGAVTSYRFAVDAELGALDVHMSIDTTSSISAEIEELQNQLESVVVAGIIDRVPDVAFGVSRFEDFPLAPFGSDGNDSSHPTARPDSPFLLLAPITKSRARLNSAILALDRPLGFGGDIPESGAEALYQIATGEGYEYDGDDIIEAFSPRRTGAAGVLGGVGFREQTLHIVLHVTDAPMHDPGDYGLAFPNTHGIADATFALLAINARVISVVSGCATEAGICGGTARDQLEAIALATGAHVPPRAGSCATGVAGAKRAPTTDTCPLVFDVNDEGEGLSKTVVDGIVELVDNLNFDEVRAVTGEDPLGLVQAVRAVEPPPAADAPTLADRFPEDAPDGILDTFVQPNRETPIEFEVLLQNNAIVQGPVEQRFRVTVRVTGDGLLLQEHGIAILVPPGSPPPPEDADAGTP